RDRASAARARRRTPRSPSARAAQGRTAPRRPRSAAAPARRARPSPPPCSTVTSVAHDDWRLRIELDEEAAGGLLARLGLLGSDARELAEELADERLAVTQEGPTIFVYASSSLQLEQAERLIRDEAAKLRIEPEQVVREHWLAD